MESHLIAINDIVFQDAGNDFIETSKGSELLKQTISQFTKIFFAKHCFWFIRASDIQEVESWDVKLDAGYIANGVQQFRSQ